MYLPVSSILKIGVPGVKIFEKKEKNDMKDKANKTSSIFDWNSIHVTKV